MEWSISLLIQVFVALLVFVLTCIVAFATWYVRKYILSEVEKNSAMREFLLGTEVEEDEGALVDLQEMHHDMEAQHEENRIMLDYVIEYVQRIADGVEADVDEPDRRWQDQTRSDD